MARVSGPQPGRRELDEDNQPILLPPELAAALIACGGRDVAVSHASAARILGLPKPLAGWGAPEFTASNGPTRQRSAIHVRVAPLAAPDVSPSAVSC